MALFLPRLGCPHLDKGFASIPAAPQPMVKEQAAELAVLVLDVVLHRSLAWSAQLVRLLHVALEHLDLLVILLLVMTNKQGKPNIGILLQIISNIYNLNFIR